MAVWLEHHCVLSPVTRRRVLSPHIDTDMCHSPPLVVPLFIFFYCSLALVFLLSLLLPRLSLRTQEYLFLLECFYF